MTLELDDLAFLFHFSLVGLYFPNKDTRAELLSEICNDLKVPKDNRQPARVKATFILDFPGLGQELGRQTLAG